MIFSSGSGFMNRYWFKDPKVSLSLRRNFQGCLNENWKTAASSNWRLKICWSIVSRKKHIIGESSSPFYGRWKSNRLTWGGESTLISSHRSGEKGLLWGKCASSLPCCCKSRGWPSGKIGFAFHRAGRSKASKGGTTTELSRSQAAVFYCEPLATKEMGYPRLSLRVINRTNFFFI